MFKLYSVTICIALCFMGCILEDSPDFYEPSPATQIDILDDISSNIDLNSSIISSSFINSSSSKEDTFVKVYEYTIEVCQDGLDNDNDGDIDCADDECKLFEFCSESTYETCSDNKDNDLDGLIDCADTKCKQFLKCSENKKNSCMDLQDNDRDGTTDCDDVECKQFPMCGSSSSSSSSSVEAVHFDQIGLEDLFTEACRFQNSMREGGDYGTKDIQPSPSVQPLVASCIHESDSLLIAFDEGGLFWNTPEYTAGRFVKGECSWEGELLVDKLSVVEIQTTCGYETMAFSTPLYGTYPIYYWGDARPDPWEPYFNYFDVWYEKEMLPFKCGCIDLH